jgi:hypothetical protein
MIAFHTQSEVVIRCNLCTTYCLCFCSLLAYAHCPLAGLENTTIVNVCAEFLEAAEVGEGDTVVNK